MNQDKTGKFIAKLRKEKNMTQEELSEKMGVSINAVSKWERGISFPDVSLYKKLCSELGISIEELINGQKDSSEEAKEKAIINTVKEASKVKKNKNILIAIIVLSFTLIISGLIIYFKSTKLDLIYDSDELYIKSIDYLRNQEFKNNKHSKEKDFNVFFSYHGFGIEKKDNYKYVYMWVYNQSYYIEKEEYGSGLAISSGISLPYKFTFKDNEIINIEYPRNNNNYYTQDINNIFPEAIAKQIINFDKEKNINILSNEVTDKKNKYYNYLNIDMNSITIDDISYGDLIFTIWNGRRHCIPVNLAVFKDGKYSLHTHYKACKKGPCTSELIYTKSIEGTYDYDVIQIIKHSTDANNLQYNMNNLPIYEIFGGNSYPFITDNDNKYLAEFLKQINVDLNTCAQPDYID